MQSLVFVTVQIERLQKKGIYGMRMVQGEERAKFFSSLKIMSSPKAAFSINFHIFSL